MQKRHSSYVYDTETQFYYLQSRYYDPEIGRFFVHDKTFDINAGIQGFNLFVYCGNQPVSRIDSVGTDSDRIEDLDLVDAEMDQLGGGSPIFAGGGGGDGSNVWRMLWQAFGDAFSGLSMASGEKAFTGSERHHIFSD